MTEPLAWASLISLSLGVILGIAICRLPEMLDGLEGKE